MAMYLGDQKITPAIVESKNVLKLPSPTLYINYDTDELYWLPNMVDDIFSSGLKGYVGLNLFDYSTSKPKLSSVSQYGTKDVNIYSVSKIYDLSSLSLGEHILKAMSVSSKKRPLTSCQYKIGNETINVPYDFDGAISSEYTELKYTRYSYTLNGNEIDGNVSGTLNDHKYYEGIMIPFNPSIQYTFNLNPKNSTTTNIYNVNTCYKENFKIFPAVRSYSSAFTKVSFTLTEDTEIKVKYLITKSDSTTPTILIFPMDKNYTSFSYSSKLANPVVSYSTTDDFEEKEYSFGTVSAGEHFYFVQFFFYGWNGTEKTWNGSITPYFDKIDEEFLPYDINITVDNENTPEYEYDAYTGEFKIKMNGNIIVNGQSTTSPLLDKLSVTPLTYDTKTATLTWEYTINDVIYHIFTPDGKEYTTSEKQFNFTNKLGEINGEFKKVKIYAEKDGNKSGVVFINLIYNPTFELTGTADDLDFISVGNMLYLQCACVYKEYVYAINYYNNKYTLYRFKFNDFINPLNTTYDISTLNGAERLRELSSNIEDYYQAIPYNDKIYFFANTDNDTDDPFIAPYYSYSIVDNTVLLHDLMISPIGQHNISSFILDLKDGRAIYTGTDGVYLVNFANDKDGYKIMDFPSTGAFKIYNGDFIKIDTNKFIILGSQQPYYIDTDASIIKKIDLSYWLYRVNIITLNNITENTITFNAIGPSTFNVIYNIDTEEITATRLNNGIYLSESYGIFKITNDIIYGFTNYREFLRLDVSKNKITEIRKDAYQLIPRPDPALPSSYIPFLWYIYNGYVHGIQTSEVGASSIYKISFKI